MCTSFILTWADACWYTIINTIYFHNFVVSSSSSKHRTLKSGVELYLPLNNIFYFFYKTCIIKRKIFLNYTFLTIKTRILPSSLFPLPSSLTTTQLTEPLQPRSTRSRKHFSNESLARWWCSRSSEFLCASAHQSKNQAKPLLHSGAFKGLFFFCTAFLYRICDSWKSSSVSICLSSQSCFAAKQG